MSKFTNLAAAAIVATFSAGAASAVTVTNPFADSESETFAGTMSYSQTYELGFMTSFDISFSSTGVSGEAGSFTYSIFDTDDMTVIASGSLTTIFDSGATYFEGADESFYYDDDFTVELTASGVSTASGGWTIISPSASLPPVPLPAGVFLLGGALGALGIARRKAA